MAYNINFNACLKLSRKQGLPDKLEKGKRYKFTKDKERIYQLRVPIELINDKWETLGKVIIHRLTIGNGRTDGVYEVVRIYSPEEKKIVSATFVPQEEVNKIIKLK